MGRSARGSRSAIPEPGGRLFEDDLKGGIWPKSVPLWLAAIYMAFFIIRPWEEMIPWLATIKCERMIALAMIGACILSRKTRFKSNAQHASTAFFFVVVALSALLAWDSDLSWDPLYQYTTYLIFYFVITSVVTSLYEFLFIVICYVLDMALYLGKSQWEYFLHGAGRWDMGVNRMWGIERTFGYPNAVAQSTVLTLPLVLCLWLHREEISANWPEKLRKLFPAFLLFYFGLAVTSVFLTNSRIGMLGLVVFATLSGLTVTSVGKKIKYLLLVVLMLGVAWQLVPEEKQNRLRTLWNPSAGPASATNSAMGRLEGFKAGIEMFQARPVLGVGIGNYKEYRVKNVDGISLNSHNMVGELLGEYGLLGGLAFFIMLATILANARKARARGAADGGGGARILASLGLASRNTILLLLFMGISSHNLMRPNWIWMCAFGLLAFELGNRPRAARGKTRALAAAAGPGGHR